MCGIIAVVLADPEGRACQLLYDGLTMLQHRGQDAAGMVTCEPERAVLHMRKSMGLVKEVFQTEHMQALRGNMGISHCRYPTAGSSSASEAQPFYTNAPFGVCLAHNGNLVNDAEIFTKLRTTSLRHSNTRSDSEALLNLFADELSERCPRGTATVQPAAVFGAVEAVIAQATGGYGVVVLINGVGIVGFRDPWGIRPLAYGQRVSNTKVKVGRMMLPAAALGGGGGKAGETAGGVTAGGGGEAGAAATDDAAAELDFAIVSESVALDVLDFDLVRDIAPGEAIFIPCAAAAGAADGGAAASGGPVRPVFKQCANPASLGFAPTLTPCLFEYVYFARPDSVLDGVSVYQARMGMGRTLAANVKKTWGEDHGVDVVVPIPDTSRTSALALATSLGVPYQEALIKNRYIARTFIMPGQPIRRSAVRLKLNCIKAEIKGRRVLLVDDSIVRGTTATQIVELVRRAGAKSVNFVSAAPKIIHPNVYGIDMPARSELIGHERTDEMVAAEIGADRVLFQDLAALEGVVKELNPAIVGFESSVFNGKYITPGVDDAYLERLAARRSDNAKKKGSESPLVACKTSTQATMASKASSPVHEQQYGGGDAEGMFNLRTTSTQ
jgi:amidophosphoribosyltransferase